MTRTRAFRLVLAAALLAIVAAACGGTTPTGKPAGSTTPGQPTTPAGSEAPSTPPAPTEPGGTAGPTAAPSGQPTPPASSNPGSADACSGTKDNKAFYLSLAKAVAWTVYCPVLPKNWWVNKGSYRLAGGGKLTITYTGPNGSSLALSEGNFCSTGDGCVPSGADAGSASFGALSGTIVALDDGGWAIVVDRGLSPSWLLVGHGMDQAGLQAIGAALAEVAG